MDTSTFDNAFIGLASQTRMDEIGFDETDLEHVILMLEEILRMVKERQQVPEK